MTESGSDDSEAVIVSMELSGEYEKVMSRLRTSEDKHSDLGPVSDDFLLLLETVAELNGGTRSAITEQLPGEMAIDYDSEAVVDALQVLERYELVVLDGNTWKPGPKLRT